MFLDLVLGCFSKLVSTIHELSCFRPAQWTAMFVIDTWLQTVVRRVFCEQIPKAQQRWQAHRTVSWATEAIGSRVLSTAWSERRTVCTRVEHLRYRICMYQGRRNRICFSFLPFDRFLFENVVVSFRWRSDLSWNVTQRSRRCSDVLCQYDVSGSVAVFQVTAIQRYDSWHRS